MLNDGKNDDWFGNHRKRDLYLHTICPKMFAQIVSFLQRKTSLPKGPPDFGRVLKH